MSNLSENRSTILPLPSSPHWAPNTIRLLISHLHRRTHVVRGRGALLSPRVAISLSKLMIVPQIRCDNLGSMRLSDIILALGEPSFHQLIRSVSIGKLKTYQLYERVKLRF